MFALSDYWSDFKQKSIVFICSKDVWYILYMNKDQNPRKFGLTPGSGQAVTHVSSLTARRGGFINTQYYSSWEVKSLVQICNFFGADVLLVVM
jgi:hypothetical protein